MPLRLPAWSPAPPRCSWSTAVPDQSPADARIGVQRAFTPCLVIDDRMRIGLAKLDAGARQFERRRFPRLMDHLVRQPRQLRHPASHIVAIGIELLALQDRIEYP